MQIMKHLHPSGEKRIYPVQMGAATNLLFAGAVFEPKLGLGFV